MKKAKRARVEAAGWKVGTVKEFLNLTDDEAALVALRRSTGNVFRDLGFSAEDAENLRIRSELMVRLTRVIEERDLTQAEAARILGITQPRVSDLVRGKIDLFPIDTLVNLLAKAGLQVTVTTRARRRVA